MVKSVSSAYRQGLRDWIIQRLSAVYMAIYSIIFIIYLVCHTALSYAEWHYLFTQTSVKIATILFIAALMAHAWIGIWTVFTDYIKCFILRCILNSLVLLVLAACLIWGVMILWSV